MSDKRITNKLPTGYGMVTKSVLCSNISIPAKALWSYYCAYTGGDEYCYPSRETIMEDMGVKKQWVDKYNKELENAGLIVKETGGGRESNKYYPMYYENEPKTEKFARTTGSRGRPGREDDRQGAANETPTINNTNNNKLNSDEFNKNENLFDETKPKHQKTMTSKKQKTPEQEDKIRQDYEHRDNIIEILNKNGFNIKPDNAFNKMFFPVLKREGYEKVKIAVNNYFRSKKNDPKFTGKIESMFYQSVRFAHFLNMKFDNDNKSALDEIEARIGKNG